ncbi:(2Fe-2S)-binding protein [Leifsonia poae]|uniref:(2Fe-2S)-binding protein n=1 Tax=Leifsonia poae TaxID=110933 RepID=UPI003D6723C9
MSESKRLPREREQAVTVEVDGSPVVCFAGETIATALLADGVAKFATRAGEPRQPLCNMGTCFDCSVVVDDRPLTRACLTPVADGMRISTGQGD